MKKLLMILLIVSGTMNLAAQQTDDGVESFERALECFQKGDMGGARVYADKVIASPYTDSYIKEKAQELIAIIIRNENPIKISTNASMNISAEGDFREFNVSAPESWTINTGGVPWCKIMERTDAYLKLWFDPNPDNVSRSGDIYIQAGEHRLTIHVHQDQGKVKRGRVYFRTTPHNAFLEVSDGNFGYSSSPLTFEPGEYSVRISKEGYEPTDTTVIVREGQDTTAVVDVVLEPLFGKLKPIVVTSEGETMADFNFRVGRMLVDISDYTNSHSFDDKETIVYYGFYKEGVIPLNPDKYQIIVSADGYQEERLTVEMKAGETTEVRFEMKSITEQLILEDKGNAAGAKVYIPELNIVAEVGDTLNVPIGNYFLQVRKDFYELDGAEYMNVTVAKGQTTVVPVRMIKVVDLYVSTLGNGERVYINGALQRYQEPVHKFKLATGDNYKLDIRKDGFWHMSKELHVGPTDTLFDFRNLKLTPTDTLRLRADEPGLVVSLVRKDTSDMTDYGEENILPQCKELNVPYRKYKITLSRTNYTKKNQILAYRGVVNFNGKRDSYTLRTWMKPGLGSTRLLSAEAYLVPGMSPSDKDFLPITIRASLIDIPLTKGLSTSLVEGALVYTKGRRDIPANGNVHQSCMPAMSILFTNYDFRVGGGFCQWGDINLLLTYTYYLQFERLILQRIKKYQGTSFDHFEGHDLFFGLELGSRLKAFNMYCRAGLQYLNGDRMHCVYNNSGSVINPKDYMKALPVNQAAFVVTVGFDLGTKEAKGQNILRIF